MSPYVHAAGYPVQETLECHKTPYGVLNQSGGIRLLHV